MLKFNTLHIIFIARFLLFKRGSVALTDLCISTCKYPDRHVLRLVG